MTQTVLSLSAAADAYLWTNVYGGTWSTAANWTYSTTGLAGAGVPGVGNSVSIIGGTNSAFTNILGAGSAGQLAISNDVLVLGSLSVGGTVALGLSADFELDGGAGVNAGGLNLAQGATLDIGGGSAVKIAGGATLAAGFLAAVNGGSVQLGTLIANSVNNGFSIQGDTIAVDASSLIEVGTTGGAAFGAITIDRGAASGALEGDVVVNSMLGVQANGKLAIDVVDPFGTPQGISGSGTLLMSESSLLRLGIADSAMIMFGGPSGTLELDVLPTGTISGFTGGDVIALGSQATAMASGVSYTQTSGSVATLTLTRGGSTVGTLTLAGNYAGSLFHLGLDPHGQALISLQTIGSPPTQPSAIIGTAGFDTLTATANSQTLTGFGGNDRLTGGTFSVLSFKDTSADLNGSMITSFAPSDMIDLTDVNVGTAFVSYTAGIGGQGTLIVTDGTHAATMGLTLGGSQPVYFSAGTDGSTGTVVRYIAVNADAY